jgi:hypothetical protein
LLLLHAANSAIALSFRSNTTGAECLIRNIVRPLSTP